MLLPERLFSGKIRERGFLIGFAAVLAVLLTLRVSVREARKENIIKKVPVTGAVMSILMLAGWMTVYVIGWIGL